MIMEKFLLFFLLLLILAYDSPSIKVVGVPVEISVTDPKIPLYFLSTTLWPLKDTKISGLENFISQANLRYTENKQNYFW